MYHCLPSTGQGSRHIKEIRLVEFTFGDSLYARYVDHSYKYYVRHQAWQLYTACLQTGTDWWLLSRVPPEVQMHYSSIKGLPDLFSEVIFIVIHCYGIMAAASRDCTGVALQPQHYMYLLYTEVVYTCG